MFFSSITLHGFKSFLDETTIPLEVGLTGVVGPNGCGKSNVVEALRWVMGESNARKMRGDDMDDIIFMGTSSRAARNLASVTLNIVNDAPLNISADTAAKKTEASQAAASHAFPHPWHDLSELAVKRTLSRGAGSTYRINGKEVRGKDVQYLFMARATGASSASMVAQGRISNIINAKAGERRLILEEAAGVRALGARRHESELKLEATNKTLEEVGNIIAGLESARNKLLKDAKQADNYRALSKEIVELEAMILTIKITLENNKIKKLEEELFQLQKEQANLISGETEAARMLATETEKNIGFKSEMEKLNDEFIEAGRALTELKAEEKRYQNELALTRQRHEEIKSDLDNALAESSQSAEQERVLLLNCETREKQYPAEEEKLHQLHKKEQDILAALTAKESTFASKQKIFADWLQTKSKASSELQFLKDSLLAYQQQIQKKKQELEDVEKKLASQSAQGNIKTMVTEAEKKYNQLEKNYGELQKKLDATKTNWLTKKEAQQLAKQEKQQAIHQQDIARKEMVAEISALKNILGEATDDILNLMEVANGFEKALAVALLDEVESGLEESKPSHWQHFGTEKLIDYASRLTLPSLLEKVSAPKPLTRNLSLTYWVEKFEEAKKMQQQLLAGEKIVSKDGGLIRWDGFTIKPGIASEDAASRKLSAKNRLKMLSEQLPALEKNNEKIRADMTTWQEKETANVKKMEEEIQGLEKELANQQTLVAEHRVSWQKLQSDMVSNLRLDEQLTTTKKILIGEISNLESQIEKAEKNIAAQAKTTDNDQADIQEKQSAIQAEEEKLKSLRQEHIDAQLLFQQQQQLVNRHHDDLKNLRANVGEVMKRKQEKEKQIILLKERIETAVENIARLSTLPATLLEKITFQEKTYDVKKNAQVNLGEKLLSTENNMRDIGKQLKSWQDKLSVLREQVARAETFADVARGNLQHFHQEAEGRELLPLEKIQSILGEKVAINEAVLAKQEIALRDNLAKRERMGPVNLLAEQNLQETATDMEKLIAEKKDLDEAVIKLQSAIAKLNSEARQKISEAFHQVNENFARLFKILFGGGEASLYFDGDSDPLTAGLEFTVHPPGKKPGPLSLLSGGEQTLTALALIFAVMDMNPPPIAVLDEVDAPLDDANIHRFTQLLRQRKIDNPQTRYLVITHHRLTMARMDRLFGVTMAEKGISTIVGVNLETAAEMVGKKVA